MKSLLRSTKLSMVLFVLAVRSVHGQSAFQNLDFESPDLPLIHVAAGGFDYVVSSNSLPGWHAYLGDTEQNLLLFNNYFLGTATVGVLGPGWSNPPPGIIEGTYTLILQAGLYPSFQAPPVDAAITQSSLVPVSTRSVQFKVRRFLASTDSGIGVYLNGERIDIIQLSATPGYAVYGGDITRFAGANAELRIAALRTPTYLNTSFALDSIVFSDQIIVPEPRVLTLFGLGALFLGWRLTKRSRS